MVILALHVIITIDNKYVEMVEQQRHRVEQEMTKMVNDIDKEYLRRMQVKALLTPNLYENCFTLGGHAQMRS